MVWSNRRFADPWAEMDQLRRQMSHLFATMDRGLMQEEENPRVNVWKNDHEVVVRAEVPGMSKEDLDITVFRGTLTLRGSRRETPVEGETEHRRERWRGSFVRSIGLPYRVDADDVSATYEDGIVEVRMPRAQDEKPRQIEVS